MSIAQLDALYQEAMQALDSGDYDTAINRALACKFRLATTPNVARAVGSGSSSLAWANAVAIDSFVAEVRKLKIQANASTYGIQQTKLTYARPSC